VNQPLRNLLRVLGLGLAAAGVAWLLLASEYTRFRTLRFVGNENASEAALRHLANLESGPALLSMDLDAAIAGVERHPWIARASARRVFPDTVVIAVEERKVQALLLLDGLYLVDQDGLPFRRADAPSLDHPVITGIPPLLAEYHPNLGRRLVTDALTLLKTAEAHPGLQARDISEVRFDPKAGYALVLRNGGEVLVGFRPASDALAQLDALTSQGVALAPSPLRIDLGSPSTVVVTPL
jgi:cell division protein FtsQ